MAVGNSVGRQNGCATDQGSLRKGERRGEGERSDYGKAKALRPVRGFTQQLGQAHFQGSFLLEGECCNRQDERRPGMSRDLGQGPGIGDPIPCQVRRLFVDNGFTPIVEPLADGPGERREPEEVCDHTIEGPGQQVSPLQVNQFVHDDLGCVLFRDQRRRNEYYRTQDAREKGRAVWDDTHRWHAPQPDGIGPMADRTHNRAGCLLQPL